MKTELDPTTIHHRSCAFQRDTVNQTQRTVQMSWCSEEPVRRSYGMEVLGCTPGEVDLVLLQSKASFLLNHNPDDQIGVVERAWMDPDKKGRAVVRFSKSAKANEMYQDVLDGIRSLISVGYSVQKSVEQKTSGGTAVWRATRWTPHELSLVALPADSTIGVGRSQEISATPPPEVAAVVKAIVTDDAQAKSEVLGGDGLKTEGSERAMASTSPASIQDTAQAESKKLITVDVNRMETNNELAAEQKAEVVEARNSEMGRIKELMALGTQHRMIEAAQKAITNGVSVDNFRSQVLATYRPEAIAAPAEIGMSKKEVKQWSMFRAIQQLASGKQLDGIEREASDAMAKMLGREATGFYIPAQDLEKRALYAGSGSGANTVQTDVGSGFIPTLRGRLLPGVTVLTGLQGNVAIPRIAGVSGQWIAQDGTAATESAATITQMTLSPKMCMTWTSLNKTLLAQSAISVQSMVEMDAAAAIGSAINVAIFTGGGTAEPTGLTTLVIGEVTLGATATRAKALDMVAKLDVGNAIGLGGTIWAMSPSARAKWSAVDTATTAGKWLWDDNSQIVGIPAMSTSDVAAGGRAFLLTPSDITIGYWASDVTVDVTTLATSGCVRIVYMTLVDLSVRHLAAHARTSDAANQ